MKNIICFKHSGYCGDSIPDLTCSSCCKIYVDKLKAKKLNPKKSSRSRQKEIVERRLNKSKNRKYDASWF